MQRVSTAVLWLALPTFVVGISLVMITAAWLMVSYVLNGFTPVPWAIW